MISELPDLRFHRIGIIIIDIIGVVVGAVLIFTEDNPYSLSLGLALLIGGTISAIVAFGIAAIIGYVEKTANQEYEIMIDKEEQSEQE